ncbi:NADPH-dependent FMN reductase [Pedobacter montanisoli]|uniref:NAD(P)H-dependent oxidoreductase n=1 Tax=Pedobacter montanisoli TaxID=2923277 RepID=A0ABS9ZWI9_9SPHI|nr:NAD(P)H-dependent oxidoreductase [Pedobacter montanisoli]MCJ0742683.1 NAD(P)H-dependent oxidoreductase [Pedobacter montanisoli]
MESKHILIISASVRKGRRSHNVALFFQNFLQEKYQIKASIADLKDYHFPIFEERLRFLENPSAQVLELSDRIKQSDGLIIVSPEYNGGYPASLKNVIDLYYDEWKRKPIAISTVSDGGFGGAQALTSLQFQLWKIGALTIPAMFPVPNVGNNYNDQGEPTDKEGAHKRATNFINELFYWIEAKKLKEANS